MVGLSLALIAAASGVAFAVARRLSGEASLIGGYFAGFATGGLIAVLYLAFADLQDETFRDATLVCLAELATLAPLLGVCAAKALGRKPMKQTAPARRPVVKPAQAARG